MSAMISLLFYEYTVQQYPSIEGTRIKRIAHLAAKLLQVTVAYLLLHRGRYVIEFQVSGQSIQDLDTDELDVKLQRNRIEINGSVGLVG